MINFIGLGAQKSATSWVYACLYEHPEICAPVKEIHFFSRERFSKGKEWYENHFKKCAVGKQTGEYSTSYLYSKETPARIKAWYPSVRLIAILRNPIERAYSQYRNAIKAGEITEVVTFEQYSQMEPGVVGQGRYFEQIERYLEHFDAEQLLVLICEDSQKDHLAFIQRIYRHLGVDPSFVPPSLHAEINMARTPRAVSVDRMMHRVAEWLRRIGLDRFVHSVRLSKLPDLVRTANTKASLVSVDSKPDPTTLVEYFRADTKQLGTFMGRNLLVEWGLE